MTDSRKGMNRKPGDVAAGEVWLSLVLQHFEACREGKEHERRKLFDIIDDLEGLFPEAISLKRVRLGLEPLNAARVQSIRERKAG